MPRRAHFVFHPEGRSSRKPYAVRVSMPRRAHFVFHPLLNAKGEQLCQSTKFQCPEGLILYFTNSWKYLWNGCKPEVSMPRRAHFVFHPSNPFVFGGPYHSYPVSMPRRAHFVFHPGLVHARDRDTRCFNAPKGSFCISPKTRFHRKTSLYSVSMPRRAHFVFHLQHLPVLYHIFWSFSHILRNWCIPGNLVLLKNPVSPGNYLKETPYIGGLKFL